MRLHCDKRRAPHDLDPRVRGDDRRGSARPPNFPAEINLSLPQRRAAQDLGHRLRAPWRAKCWRSSSITSMSPACRRNCTTILERIPEAVRAKIRANREAYDEILCLYGDCGTGGELDRVLEEERRKAHRGRALLRVLRWRRGLLQRLMRKSRARSSSRIFLPAISTRSSFEASPSTAFLSCATITSAITGGWSIWRSSTIPIWRPRRGRPPNGSASPTSAASPASTGFGYFSKARRRRRRRRGQPDHSLLARHPESGDRESRTFLGQAAIVGAVHSRDRRGGDACRREERRRLSR